MQLHIKTLCLKEQNMIRLKMAQCVKYLKSTEDLGSDLRTHGQGVHVHSPQLREVTTVSPGFGVWGQPCEPQVHETCLRELSGAW